MLSPDLIFRKVNDTKLQSDEVLIHHSSISNI